MRRVVLSLVFAVGCTAPASEQAIPHATVCTGDLYDACADADDCSSGECHAFDQAGFAACTQACDAANPCPDQDGAPVRCNKKGRCRPDAANACALP